MTGRLLLDACYEGAPGSRRIGRAPYEPAALRALTANQLERQKVPASCPEGVGLPRNKKR